MYPEGGERGRRRGEAGRDESVPFPGPRCSTTRTGRHANAHAHAPRIHTPRAKIQSTINFIPPFYVYAFLLSLSLCPLDLALYPFLPLHSTLPSPQAAQSHPKLPALLVVRSDVPDGLDPYLCDRDNSSQLQSITVYTKLPLIALTPSSSMYSIPADSVTRPAAISRKRGYGTKCAARDINFTSTMNHLGLASSDFCGVSNKTQAKVKDDRGARDHNMGVDCSRLNEGSL